ncbi:MAG: hypothetical protein KGI67_08150 [Pseudomonadota bacterium]|nr:hypothetical protein [Pseudomonadota bacterium]
MNIESIFAAMRGWFRHSPRIHIRSKGVAGPTDLVRLIDRFVDGCVEYPLEWDDFISWRQSNAHVERAREQIGAAERLLFSKSASDRKKYVAVVLEERNKLAMLVGLPCRANEEQSGAS